MPPRMSCIVRSTSPRYSISTVFPSDALQVFFFIFLVIYQVRGRKLTPPTFFLCVPPSPPMFLGREMRIRQFVICNSLATRAATVCLQGWTQNGLRVDLECAVFLCAYTTVWLPMRVDVNACDCTWELYKCCKNLRWKPTLGEKSLGELGSQTCWAVCQIQG